MDAAPIPIDTLLAHREWVRAVARAVVRDPNAADDIEQETWLAALRTPPRDASSLRGWFGAVTRSRARRIGRTDSRREAREADVARGERTASAAELAEIADTHRRVVAAVVELDEPYRETILLRYFEGLSIEEVAARTSSPIETTRSRVKRGVAKLRERLEREFGVKGRPWHLALVPLIGGARETSAGAGIGAAAGGGVVMASTTKTALAVAGVLLLFGVGAVVVPKWMSSEEKVVADVPVAPPPAAPVRRVPEPVRSSTPRQRPAPEPLPAEEAANVPPVKPAFPAETVPERLAKVKLGVDWKDAKLVDVFAEIAARSGVEIALQAEEATDWELAGRIESLRLDQEVPAGQILQLVTDLRGLSWVVEEPRVVVLQQATKRDTSKPLIVPPPWVPPPGLTVIGRVTDAAGAALPGATIVRVVNGDERVVATADIAGRFEVKLGKPYGSLEAHAAGRQPSLAVAVTGEPGAQVTLDLATRGEAGTVVVKLITDVRPFPSVYVTVGHGEDVPSILPDGGKAVRRARRVSSREASSVTFEGIAAGTGRVSVRSEEFEADAQVVEVVAGRTVEVELRLVRKLSLAETLATKRTSFNFDGARAGDIVKYLNTVHSISIVIDPAIAVEAGRRAITLSLKDRPLDEALRELCREIGGATYVVRGPVVFITAEKR